MSGDLCMGSHEGGPCEHPRHNQATGKHDLPEVAPAEETLSDAAARVRQDIQIASDTLRRIMEHEAPYLGEP